MNKVILTGRVTKDIEMRTTQSGHNIVNFNIAVDGPKNKDGVKSCDFPSIVAWNKTAELCARYLHKGDKVGIIGKIQTSNYEKDGHKVYETKVLASEVEFLSPKNQAQEPPAGVTTVGEPTADGFQEVSDSELPF